MSKNIDFLKPDVVQIKKSIKGIDDSYNNEWDILAELIQNAVDAIRLKYSENNDENYKGIIDIYINSGKKTIKVKDNGVGISKNDLPHLLRPFSSDKEVSTETIGEKGVGLTFALFSCNLFEIETGNKNGSSKAFVKDALNWKKSVDSKSLNMEIDNGCYDINGTSITLSHMENLDIFDLNNDQMKYLIRTKTAIGNTEKIWHDSIDITVNYEFYDSTNTYYKENLPFEYFNIINDLRDTEKISLDEFFKKTKETMVSDREKRVMLKDKIIYKMDTIQHSGNRIINYLAYFIPSRNAWETLNKQYNLIPSNISEEELNDYLNKYYYAQLGPGIFTAVKGMPTGISINHPSTGNAGYWPNMFILFQDNKLSFDIGRKSIHGSQQNILKKYSKNIFNEFAKIVSRYGARNFDLDDNTWNKESTFESINNMRNLDEKKKDKTIFQKIPNKQEAQVSAMFYEQIGKGNIQGLTLYTTGYKGKYDLYGKLENKGNVVIEFKSELRNILKDFNDEQKLFDEIDCIVCWNVSEEDKDKFHEYGISVIDNQTKSLFSNDNNDFDYFTHRLELSNFSKPIYVIDLMVLLDE
ncbi:ATP-binding protein [Mammaliicoccus sciuri]|uniref:ATP-binding protein n=1 Tax=Mammaliicoccus sciuri TaxID=1296 RepID=UPI00195462DC|nr:ATP-binding protein [Mammaliicoccus sciuri]MCD8809239.1 ATP-binding protein [Mammaliicoccus sciuri]MEB7816239.1 ATP-binding protein [Mammaliicoccus sciuri]